jgi:hypothetical protein
MAAAVGRWKGGGERDRRWREVTLGRVTELAAAGSGDAPRGRSTPRHPTSRKRLADEGVQS